MNRYNPDKHHRRSIRLGGYDYLQAGLYFVTICIQNHECLFGRTSHSGRTHRFAPTSHRVVQWFKTMTTNEYIRGVKSLGWKPFIGKLWQRNYYEHIIRNHQSFFLWPSTAFLAPINALWPQKIRYSGKPVFRRAQ